MEGTSTAPTVRVGAAVEFAQSAGAGRRVVAVFKEAVASSARMIAVVLEIDAPQKGQNGQKTTR